MASNSSEFSESNPSSSPADTPSSAPLLIVPGLWRRMACWLYEGMLLFAVVFVAGWLFSTLGQMRDAMDSRRHLLQAFLFVVFGVYFVWFWTRGQTLAMKTWNIRIVDAHGRPITQTRALARYLLSWIWFLPPLAAIAPFKLSGGESTVLIFGWVAVWALLARFHPERQFWHDAWAGTRLITSKPMSRR
ncbi:RDD family protein [Variovorax beijingensis]|uniref:RDD family protein n=1 Tax=Variovorax beijingensis TaxID=2496117 RepID=A0A3P3EWI7_9BURK|nr:RDD family protein [Variovorax beijingensis]RRH90567.1 RDD family protein [Variovorax beijingensis]RSZ34573.1 RDD family protein [Variovorax beijingensis]